jgi:hypothetical protein
MQPTSTSSSRFAATGNNTVANVVCVTQNLKLSKYLRRLCDAIP